MANGGASNGKKSELKPQQRFEIIPGPPLGKGHFAVVKKCRDTVTGRLCAVKIIDKKELVKSTASVVKQEIEILRAVGAHPNIVQLLDHWEDATKHYLVLELCEGGDLFSQIVEHGKYSEKDAVRCCKQLAEALKHIHACGITHRDLKPENVLLAKKISSDRDNLVLKIADFGLSKLIKGHLHPMRTVCVTQDHSVLVRDRGWVPIAQVEEDDFVWALAGLGAESARWSRVMNTVITPLECSETHEVTEPLVRFRSAQGVDLLVTRDHSMWTRDQAKQSWAREQAIDVPQGQREIALAAPNDELPFRWELAFLPADVNTARDRSEAWCELIGAVLRAGSVEMEDCHARGYREEAKMIVLQQQTGGAAEEFSALLQRLGWLVPDAATAQARRDAGSVEPVFYWQTAERLVACHSGLYDFFWPMLHSAGDLSTAAAPMPLALAAECFMNMARGEDAAQQNLLQQSAQPALRDWGLQHLCRLRGEEGLQSDAVADPLASSAYPGLSLQEVEQLKQLLVADSSMTESELQLPSDQNSDVNRTLHYPWRFRLCMWQCRALLMGFARADAGAALEKSEQSDSPLTTFTSSSPLLVDDLMTLAARASFVATLRPQPDASIWTINLHAGRKSEHALATIPLFANTHEREVVYDHGFDTVYCVTVMDGNFLVRRDAAGDHAADGPTAAAFIGNCGTWAYCVAEDTLLRCRDARSGKLDGVCRARDVSTRTQLVDEFGRAVAVKAIHTDARSVAPLWRVLDAETNELLFRCTADHKLSFLEEAERCSGSRARVEVRCSEFAALSSEEQQRLWAYTASDEAFPSSSSLSTSTSPSSPKLNPAHVGRTLRVRVEAPAADAPLERFVGIEVASETHRFQLAAHDAFTNALIPSSSSSTSFSSLQRASASFGLVTSNCAPEVIQRRPYDSSVDRWTLGVLMYILLSGYHPFDVYGECPEPELLAKIMACEYDFDDPIWTGISDEAKSLIRRLLVLDPAKRLSLEDYLASPWIRGREAVSQADNPLVLERLSKFGVGNKFRSLVVAKLASQKFKASISRSKTRRAGGGAAGGATLPDGSPDYLGLHSERGGAGTSLQNSARGLESVREGRGGGGGAHLGTANQFEPSHTAGMSSVGNRGGIISVNGLGDLVSTRRGNGVGLGALNDGVLMLHGGVGAGGLGGGEDGDTDIEWARDSDADTPLPRSSRAGSVGGGFASGPVSGGSSPVVRRVDRDGTGGGGSGGITVAANASGRTQGDKPKGGLTGHRSNSHAPSGAPNIASDPEEEE